MKMRLEAWIPHCRFESEAVSDILFEFAADLHWHLGWDGVGDFAMTACRLLIHFVLEMITMLTSKAERGGGEHAHKRSSTASHPKSGLNNFQALTWPPRGRVCCKVIGKRLTPCIHSPCSRKAITGKPQGLRLRGAALQ